MESLLLQHNQGEQPSSDVFLGTATTNRRGAQPPLARDHQALTKADDPQGPGLANCILQVHTNLKTQGQHAW